MSHPRLEEEYGVRANRHREGLQHIWTFSIEMLNFEAAPSVQFFILFHFREGLAESFQMSY